MRWRRHDDDDNKMAVLSHFWREKLPTPTRDAGAGRHVKRQRGVHDVTSFFVHNSCHHDEFDATEPLYQHSLSRMSAYSSCPLATRSLIAAVLLVPAILATSMRGTCAFTPTLMPRHYTRHYVPLAAATLDEIPSTEQVMLAEESIDEDNAFNLLAGRAAVCLLQSDMRRDAIGKPGGAQASSATNWINDASAFALQKAFDKMELKLADERTGLDRDEASTWIRWIKSTPTPLIVDLSDNLRAVANTTISDHSLNLLDITRDKFLRRMGCRLLLFPSGATLKSPLTEPPASIIYGKLLFGGVTRYRLLVSSNSQRASRKAGERTEVKASVRDHVPVWMQYGGPDRQYEAVDIGAAAILEVMLLPRGQELASIAKQVAGDMTASRIMWPPQKMFGFVGSNQEQANGSSEIVVSDEAVVNGNTPMSLSGKERNEAFASDFQSCVGGLQPQIDAIVRRVLDGRVIRPADADEKEQDGTTAELALASMESEELAILGLTPVRGLLLYGPPGCGKTALAREISRALRARAPKIVSAPELLDRWVGGSEKLVRALFADAEAELAACGGDARKSALHVIVIDEIDAVFRKRTAAEDSGEATRASAVNQILAKLDGVKAIPNILLVGMTNRRELLDEALLRPGRLEVQIEIPLPDKEGRRDIFRIHFDALRKKGRLSKPLCCAIDGVADYDSAPVDGESREGTEERVSGRKRAAVKRVLTRIAPSVMKPTYDLAADYATGGYSGADIAGLVRCAGSIALARARRDGFGVDGLLITLEDAKEALREVNG